MKECKCLTSQKETLRLHATDRNEPALSLKKQSSCPHRTVYMVFHDRIVARFPPLCRSCLRSNSPSISAGGRDVGSLYLSLKLGVCRTARRLSERFTFSCFNDSVRDTLIIIKRVLIIALLKLCYTIQSS